MRPAALKPRCLKFEAVNEYVNESNEVVGNNLVASESGKSRNCERFSPNVCGMSNDRSRSLRDGPTTSATPNVVFKPSDVVLRKPPRHHVHTAFPRHRRRCTHKWSSTQWQARPALRTSKHRHRRLHLRPRWPLLLPSLDTDRANRARDRRRVPLATHIQPRPDRSTCGRSVQAGSQGTIR